MKWDSLSYSQQNALRNEHDKRHADSIPQKPEFVAPPTERPAAIELSTTSDIYARIKKPHRSDMEALTQLRMVGPNDHIEIDIPVEALPALIAELTRRLAEVTAHNEAVQTYLNASKEYKEAKERYETQRDRKLKSLLSSGKYTADDIDNRPNQIPF